ncbi:hypothetical protein [Neoroseomonas soli]|uniref:HNH endonuclease n=1 Tax=Neoroseomonas soli TaxID=1081025 RepID=A0A9X9X0I5_9PROT|nr:hypothetical protein [Neoroseomonas soli]MBR0672914.1 hypothetical protein [Neoroseomonas soli]
MTEDEKTAARRAKKNAWKRAHYAAHRDAALAKQRRFRADNPDARRTHAAVHRAIRSGKLVRPDACERCGGPNPHAHHADYARPLDVQFLCQSCHNLEHSAVTDDDKRATRAAADRRYREANRDTILARKAGYREANRERIAARERERYAANR